MAQTPPCNSLPRSADTKHSIRSIDESSCSCVWKSQLQILDIIEYFVKLMRCSTRDSHDKAKWDREKLFQIMIDLCEQSRPGLYANVPLKH